MTGIPSMLCLWLYGFFWLCFFPLKTAFILGTFLSLTLGAASLFLKSRNLYLACSVIFSGISWFFPSFAAWAPLILYGTFRRRFFLPAIMACLTLALHPELRQPEILFFLLFGAGLASLLAFLDRNLETVTGKYQNLRDDLQERNLLLKEKNKTLLEKQDYEIYTATLQERNRIAREIHDNVGHMLTRAILLTGAVRAVSREPAIQNSLENLEATLSQAMGNIRQSVHDLHDEAVSLEEALRELVRDFTFCPVSLEYDVGPELPRDVKYGLISIVKEALVNVSRHSNATKVHIILQEHPGFWQLILEDNGTVPGEISSSGIGLAGMKERIHALHGRIEFSKTPGFRIFAAIPKGSDFSSATSKKEEI